jgi:hypothetical protein
MSQLEAMLEELIVGLDKHGGSPGALMRAEEQAKGRKIIQPGDVAWFPADEWESSCVVSQCGKDVRLIAILAKRPNTGSFQRMVKGIVQAGLRPVIVCPTREMDATLTRWGWKTQHVGSFPYGEMLKIPTAKWMKSYEGD